MTFKVGQKVVCVDPEPDNGFSWHEPKPIKYGEVYTIAAMDAGEKYGHPTIQLIEVPRVGCHQWFRRSRFRPAVETKTDISVFTKMLVPDKETVV